MGLFKAWYELEMRNSGVQKDILDRLNAECGTKYRSNWVSQLMNPNSRSSQGLTRTPGHVRRYMMRAILRDRLHGLGVPDAAIEELLNDLV